MRKAQREVTDPKAVEALLARGKVIHLALNRDGAPYVVPMNYGVKDGVIYLHCAKEGTRLDLLRADGRVGFSVVVNYALRANVQGCESTAHYASVCGAGTARVVEDPAEKRLGLEIIAAQVAPLAGRDFPEKVVDATCVLAVTPERLSGKQNPPPPAAQG